MKKLLLVMTIVSLTGCALPPPGPGNEQIGALNSVKDLSWIKKGVTTGEQVMAKLGEPSTNDASDSQTTLTYDYLCQPKQANLGLLLIPVVGAIATSAAANAKDCHGHKTSNTRVQIVLDSKERVSDYTFNMSVND